MAKELTVLKLGGALITDKSKPYSFRPEVLNSATHEIRECMDDGLIESLVLVQGVGSFGHPPVLEHKLHKGFKGPEQLLPLTFAQKSVAELRTHVVQACYDAGIPACLMYPSSMMVSEKMQIVRYFLEPLERFLSLGMVPLIGGDILVDTVMGFSVGSGDPMLTLIAREFGAKRILYASDVSGIYDSDPKTNPDAVLFDEIDLSNLDDAIKKMGKAGVEDASGAMRGKVASIEPVTDLIKEGLEVSILSMMEYGSLKALLNGDTSKSTQIVVK
ncbi:MAG: isopentenyl phosphate kinase [Candidatus Thorarchaeota archaeon]